MRPDVEMWRKPDSFRMSKLSNNQHANRPCLIPSRWEAVHAKVLGTVKWPGDPNLLCARLVVDRAGGNRAE